MALNAQYSDAAVNAAVDALAALLDGGYLRLYTTPQAANANTALGAQTQLAELRFGSPAFAGAAAGVATANAITADTDADATGAAAWYRCLKGDGTTVVCDGSVGTAAANLVLNSTAIQQHAQVSVTAFTLTLPEA